MEEIKDSPWNSLEPFGWVICCHTGGSGGARKIIEPGQNKTMIGFTYGKIRR